MKYGSLFLACAVFAGCGDDDVLPILDAGAMDAGNPDVGSDAGNDTGPEPDAGPVCEDGEVPLGRGEHSMIYDTRRDRLVAFGGTVAFPEMCMPRYEYTDEVWVFDPVCQTWTQNTPSIGGPGRRARQAMVHDAAGDRAIAFGGRTYEGGFSFRIRADIHVLDLETMAWTELIPANETLPPRSHAAMAFDEPGNRLVVFGGNLGGGVFSPELTSDTWEYDLATNEWTELTPAESPGARYGHAFTQVGRKMYVYGGSGPMGSFANDVWEFDLDTNEWTGVRGGGPDSPPSRFGAALFDDGAGGLLMALGHDATDLGNVNDLWHLNLTTNAWTELRHGDVLSGVANGICDFPADFTTPDLEGPERRNFQGYASGGGQAFISFGKTDCGNANDMWTIDLAAPDFALAGSTTTSGEACNRSGREDCTSLCF